MSDVPDRPDDVERPAAPSPRRRRVRRPRRAVSGPTDRPASDEVLPRSPDDSDVGWGDPAGPDDDERLRREVPPHWQ